MDYRFHCLEFARLPGLEMSVAKSTALRQQNGSGTRFVVSAEISPASEPILAAAVTVLAAMDFRRHCHG